MQIAVAGLEPTIIAPKAIALPTWPYRINNSYKDSFHHFIELRCCKNNYNISRADCCGL